MENKDRNEKMLDALIKIASEEAMINELSNIPSCEELDRLYVPSPQFKKRMEKSISEKRRPKQFRTALKLIGKAAAAFAVLFTVSAVALLSVEASRNYIFNTLISWRNDHTEFNFAENDKTGLGDYVLGYVPEGFFLESSDAYDDMKIEIYIDKSDRQIIYQQYVAENFSNAVDNENKDYSVIDIGGIQAHFFETTLENDFNILLWQQKQYVFKIISDINPQEIVTIAENIEIKK